MFRRVRDLEVGDYVRPFDEHLWQVSNKRPSEETPGWWEMAFSHPVNGVVWLTCAPDDLVRLQ